MKGSDFVDALRREFEVASDLALAEMVGYTQTRINQLRGESVTPRMAVNLCKRFADSHLARRVDLIRPIVEFFPVEDAGADERSFIDLELEDRKKLRHYLRKTRGIYSFYNSEMEIIYIGKTKNNLWHEMKQTFNRKMNSYFRYSVNHPHGKFKLSEDGVRHIKRKEFYFRDAARYFSAYSVSEEFIDIAESLLIRIVPNDLLNVQMAANSTLISYSHEEDGEE